MIAVHEKLLCPIEFQTLHVCADVIQVKYPLSEMLGTGSVSDFGFLFHIFEHLQTVMRYLGDGKQI
jgi:hypothetical protein